MSGPRPLKLGVNIDHVATLREARYRGRTVGEPDPVDAALVCESAGAAGITAHLREDRRHIQDRDVRALRARIRTRLNLEMALAPEIVDFAVAVKPDIVCLVPERREEVTTEGGLDVVGQREQVAAVARRMNEAGVEVSLFVGPDTAQIEASAATGAQFVELHTGAYAEAVLEGHGAERELARLVAAAERARAVGLRVNAGHGLTVPNLPALLACVPYLEELNIGHSLVGRAVTVGLAAAVGEFLAVMRAYRRGPA
ncbi:MAG: pyridoxine 5'-phosphate synthase [Verrucomicrobiales bacterium]|nr:pyridoxine 5'-phosphate synthase [Verrucomicrobiales bacterium]